MENFNLIDMTNWERKEHFNHFSKYSPCSYSITSNVNIANLYNLAKNNSLKLYPLLIICCSNVVNSIKEFRFDYNEKGQLGYYNTCHPSYTIANSCLGSFSGIWTFCENDTKGFYKNIVNDTICYGKTCHYAPKANQPKNTFYVSCTPEISFTSLNVHLYNGKNNLTPIITFGKYFKNQDELLMPLAISLNHCVCDGYHTSLFYKNFQEAIDTFKI